MNEKVRPMGNKIKYPDIMLNYRSNSKTRVAPGMFFIYCKN